MARLGREIVQRAFGSSARKVPLGASGKIGQTSRRRRLGEVGRAKLKIYARVIERSLREDGDELKILLRAHNRGSEETKFFQIVSRSVSRADGRFDGHAEREETVE